MVEQKLGLQLIWIKVWRRLRFLLYHFHRSRMVRLFGVVRTRHQVAHQKCVIHKQLEAHRWQTGARGQWLLTERPLLSFPELKRNPEVSRRSWRFFWWSQSFSQFLGVQITSTSSYWASTAPGTSVWPVTCGMQVSSSRSSHNAYSLSYTELHSKTSGYTWNISNDERAGILFEKSFSFAVELDKFADSFL